MKNKIIPALDVGKEQAFELVEKLEEVKSDIAGYKVGSLLVMENSIDVLKELKGATDIPIIYDGQKLGTDIPDIVKKQVQLLAEANVDQLIIAPMGSGSEVLRVFSETCKEERIEPICVVRMTHPRAESYLRIQTELEIFSDAKEYGIKKFVFPATKPEVLETLKEKMMWFGGDEILMATGFKVQGGKTEVLRDLGVTEFIVGRAIYQAENPVQAIKDILKEINK